MPGDEGAVTGVRAAGGAATQRTEPSRSAVALPASQAWDATPSGPPGCPFSPSGGVTSLDTAPQVLGGPTRGRGSAVAAGLCAGFPPGPVPGAWHPAGEQKRVLWPGVLSGSPCLLQAFFTERYLQEHPEAHEKIEKLKDLIAWQVNTSSDSVSGPGSTRDPPAQGTSARAHVAVHVPWPSPCPCSPPTNSVPGPRP